MAPSKVVGMLHIPRSVFVLDNDAEALGSICAQVRRIGAECVGFQSSQALTSSLADAPADLILLDVRLGADDLDSIEVLRALSEARCRSAILLVSGVDTRLRRSVEAIGREYGLNIVGGLAKPFDSVSLRETILALTAAQPAAASGEVALRDLHRALRNREFALHYQRQVDVRSGETIGVEALIRWHHPRRGLLAPAEFLSLAESSGLINPLTDWVLDEALRQQRAWWDQGLRGLAMSVNVPAKRLADPSFSRLVLAALARHDIPGAALKLEVTETGVMEDVITALDVLTQLRLKDVTLSIDDFGTGHSSLVKLRQIPFSEIKIDRSFVTDLDSDEDCTLLTRTIIDLAHCLNMHVVAEGVETLKAMQILRSLGCDLAQGYFIERPIPAAELFGAREVA
jgi:EAL domain-containing protein (putative c-di-GMP-specific phosphodiesterase class I)